MIESTAEERSVTEGVPSVTLRHASKTFDGIRVLDDVEVDLLRGEIHALVGENGSGKSTLIKILSGFHEPDPGTQLWVRGKPVTLPVSPADVASLGFRFVHQELALSDAATVVENVRMGSFQTGPLGGIRWKREVEAVRVLLSEYGFDMDPLAVTGELSSAERAIVAIARAMNSKERDRTLLVLDEPTSYLPPTDRTRLFNTLHRAAEQGLAVLFSSHQLDDVVAHAARVTILRDGKRVATQATASVTKQELVSLIIGRDLDEFYPPTDEIPSGAAVMSVRGLAGAQVHDISLDLREGEIMGLTGLVGAGHDEVPYLLSGATRLSAGAVSINGVERRRLDPAAAVKAGLALLPANRHRDSGVLEASLIENMSLPSMKKFTRWGRIDRDLERTSVASLLESFDVRPRTNPHAALSSLSGGNQQKVLLAKWIGLHHSRILVLHEPTQGVDVGSKRAIFDIILDAARKGAAILIVSAEYAELANICDRVLVMREGTIRAELSGPTLSEARIIEQCFVSGERDGSWRA